MNGLQYKIPEDNYTYEDVKTALAEAGINGYIELIEEKHNGIPRLGVTRKDLEKLLEIFGEDERENPSYSTFEEEQELDEIDDLYREIIAATDKPPIRKAKKTGRVLMNNLKALGGLISLTALSGFMIPSTAARYMGDDENRIDEKLFAPVDIVTGKREECWEFDYVIGYTHGDRTYEGGGRFLGIAVSIPLVLGNVATVISSTFLPFIDIRFLPLTLTLLATNTLSFLYERRKWKKEDPKL